MKTRLELAYVRLSDEHQQLMALVDRLKSRDSGLDMVAFLEELHRVLIKHFAHEQFPDGLYESMGAYGSAYHDELKVLIKEHCAILSAVSGLLGHARATRRADQPSLSDELVKIVGMLREHERKEHLLAEKLMGNQPAQVST